MPPSTEHKENGETLAYSRWVAIPIDPDFGNQAHIQLQFSHFIRTHPKMQTTDHLLQLIRSLDKGEKRVFRQHAKTQMGKKAYVELFRQLNKANPPDEDKIVEALGMEKRPQSYYNLKNYLFRFLLKTLLHSYGGLEGTLERKVLYVKILINKRLFPQAKKILVVALGKAQNEERFVLALELSRLHQTIHAERGRKGELETIRGYRRNLIPIFRNWCQYERLTDEFQPHFRVFRSLFCSNFIAAMRELLKNPLFMDAKLVLSARAKRCFFGVRYVGAMMEGNLEEALEQSMNLIRLFEANPFLKTDHFDEYVAVRVNSGRLHLALGDLIVTQNILNTSMNTHENQVNTLAQLELATLQLDIAIKTGDLETGTRALAKL